MVTPDFFYLCCVVDVSKYAPHDFEKMMFPVYTTNLSGDVLKIFPILKLYPAFTSRISLPFANVFMYICYCYDMHSPLMTVDDIMQRRHEAAVLAGFRYNEKTDKFPEQTEEFLLSRNEKVNFMILQFLILQFNDDWMTYIGFQNSLHQLNYKIMTGTYNATDITAVKTLRAEIKNLKQDMMMDKFDPLLRKSLYIFGEAAKIKVSPEHYARTLKVRTNV